MRDKSAKVNVMKLTENLILCKANVVVCFIYIFGLDVGTTKGNTTETKPILVVDDFIEIPSKYVRVKVDLILTLYGMTVNSLKILTTIQNTCYIGLFITCLQQLRHLIEDVLCLYKMGSFHVVEIRCEMSFELQCIQLPDYNLLLYIRTIQTLKNMFQRQNETIELSKTSTGMISSLALCTSFHNIDKVLDA